MDVAAVAKLANIPISKSQENKFQSQFAQTLDTISVINELDVSQTQPTSQVTGLENVTRPDKIDPTRILTQAQALANSPSTSNGYFQVSAIFNDA